MGTRQKPVWEDRFINLLSQTCNVTLSAKGANVSRKTAYQYKKQSAEFAQRWREATTEAVELLEAQAWKRASSTSDALMMFLLKAYKPNKYQDRSKIVHEFSVKELDQLRQIKALLSKTDTPASEMFNDLIAELQAQDAEHP